MVFGGPNQEQYRDRLAHVDANSLREFSAQIIAVDPLLGLPHKDYISIVSAGINELFPTASVEEIEAAKQAFIKQGKALREQGDSFNMPHFSWLIRMRKLAKFTPGFEDIEIVYHDDSDAPIRSTNQFWQEIYTEVSGDYGAKNAVFVYTLGPDIESKDTEYLQVVNDRLDSESAGEVLGSMGLKGNKLSRVIFDSFSLILREAADAGWGNAKALQNILDRLPKRNMPLHSLVIALSNRVTAIFNREGVLDGKRKFDKLNLYDILHVPEAINRCLYLVFDFGKEQPKGHDPINYQLTGQILGKMAIELDEQLRG